MNKKTILILVSCLAHCGQYGFKSHISKDYVSGTSSYQFETDKESNMPNIQIEAGISTEFRPTAANNNCVWTTHHITCEPEYVTQAHVVPQFGANVNWSHDSNYQKSVGFRTIYGGIPLPYVGVSKAVNDNSRVGVELNAAEEMVINYEYTFAESE